MLKEGYEVESLESNPQRTKHLMQERKEKRMREGRPNHIYHCIVCGYKLEYNEKDDSQDCKNIECRWSITSIALKVITGDKYF